MTYVNSKPSGSRSTLVLVRHAHTDMAGTFCGTSDPPLSAQGLAQLDGLCQRLERYPLTHIFSSGLERARHTAESIARPHRLKVQHLEFLHELAFGSWEGLNWDQVMARDSQYARRWLDQHPLVPAPGGEHFEDFFERVQYAMTAIAAQVGPGCAAVVTHGGVIRTFLESVARLREVATDFAECDYASYREVWCTDGEWHLPGEGAILRARPGAKVLQPEQQELIL